LSLVGCIPFSYYPLNDINVTILTVSTTQVTTTYPWPTELGSAPLPYGPVLTPGGFAYAINGGTPVTGSVIPTFSTVVPMNSNNFQGGITIDNQVIWVNRGIPVENWGITNTPTTPLVPVVSPLSEIGTGYPGVQVPLYSSFTQGSSFGSGIFVVDSNNNIQ